MRTRYMIICSLAVLGVVALGSSGCDDSDLIAPSDGSIVVVASPPTAAVDAANLRGRSTIGAQVLDVDGFPVENVVVSFQPDGGSFVDNVCQAGACSLDAAACATDADCPLPATTAVSLESDAQGVATAGLVVTAADPETVIVTAQSGAVSGRVEVTNLLGIDNDPPEALIDVFPSSPALSGEQVEFDGQGSSDPDGDDIECWQWTVLSSEPIEAPEQACLPPDDNCTVFQGPNERSITLSYVSQQTLNVTLRVSDDPTLACPRSTIDGSAFNGFSDSINGYVICDNSRPLANAGADQVKSQTVDGVGSPPTVSVVLDASGSSDAETADSALTYEWTCGNGQTVFGETAVCTYTSTGFFSVILNVEDDGEGACSPVPCNGRIVAACEEEDGDTMLVTINP